MHGLDLKMKGSFASLSMCVDLNLCFWNEDCFLSFFGPLLWNQYSYCRRIPVQMRTEQRNGQSVSGGGPENIAVSS